MNLTQRKSPFIPKGGLCLPNFKMLELNNKTRICISSSSISRAVSFLHKHINNYKCLMKLKILW